MLSIHILSILSQVKGKIKKYLKIFNRESSKNVKPKLDKFELTFIY